MHSVKQTYQVFQALSLDIVIGAVVCSIAISTYYHVSVSYSAIACLAIAVWLIYTLDHLLDAKKIAGKPTTFRHQFHKQFKKPLVACTILVTVLGATIACYLPPVILYNGLIGIVLTFVYFLLLQKKTFWQKEICIAIGYTWGILLAPICLYQGTLSLLQLILIPKIFLIVFANLLIFSWFDVLKDKQDGHKSMVIHWGIKHTERIISLILRIEILLAILTFFLNPKPTTFMMQGLLLLMLGLLLFIFKKHYFFRKNDIYRVIGDGVFYLPLLFIVYARLHQL